MEVLEFFLYYLDIIWSFLMDALSWSFSNDDGLDIVRKMLGYLPIMWSLKDDYSRATAAPKGNTTGTQQRVNTTSETRSRMCLSKLRYLIFLDFILILLSKHQFVEGQFASFMFALVLVLVGWHCVKELKWLKLGPYKMRTYIVYICVFCASITLCDKYIELIPVVFPILILIIFCSSNREKWVTIFLAVISFNWPLLVLAIKEKYPITSTTYIQKHHEIDIVERIVNMFRR